MEHQKEKKALGAPISFLCQTFRLGMTWEPSDAEESIYERTAALSADSLAIIGSTLPSSPWVQLRSLRDTP